MKISNKTVYIIGYRKTDNKGCEADEK